MISRNLFKIIYISVIIVLAIVGYALDTDKGKFFRAQKDGLQEEDDDDDKTDVRQTLSNILCICVFIGLFGLVFVLDDNGGDLIDPIARITDYARP